MASDDPLRELLQVCDRSPEEGLDWVSRLDDELLARPTVLFAKFIAHRHLAIDRLFHAGFPEGLAAIPGLDEDQIRPFFGRDEIAHAQDALGTIARIEKIDATYVSNRDFAEAMVDSVCMPYERLFPGLVQHILHWTKLIYFGSERVGFRPDVIDRLPDDLAGKVLHRRFVPDDVARSAMGMSLGSDPDKGRFVEFAVLLNDFNRLESMAESIMIGRLRLYDDGAPDYYPHAGDDD